MSLLTPQTQLEAVGRMRDKYRREGKKTLSALVAPETVAAFDYLKATTPGGFNYRQFVEDKLMEEAKKHGYKPE